MPTLLSEAALRLRQHIAQFVALRDDDWDLLLPHLRLVTIKKHGLFAQEGRLAGQVAFVLEGMFRQFYTKDGEERTTYFFFENHLLSAYMSCLTGRPSLVTIEALSEASYLTFPYAVLTELFEQRMAWQKFGRLAEYLGLGLEERMVSLLLLSPEERYRALLAGSQKKPGTGAPALRRQLPGRDASKPEPHPQPDYARAVAWVLRVAHFLSFVIVPDRRAAGILGRYSPPKALCIMNVLPNPSAPVITHQRVVIEASPAQIWAVLTDINNWAAWLPNVKRPQLNGGLHPGTTFDWKSNGAGIHSTLHTVAPAHELGWTGKSLGVYAIHNWTLTAVPSGTEVVVDESMQGLLASLFQGSLNRGLAKSTLQWLELLKAEAEKMPVCVAAS